VVFFAISSFSSICTQNNNYSLVPWGLAMKVWWVATRSYIRYTRPHLQRALPRDTSQFSDPLSAAGLLGTFSVLLVCYI
jgi:hypothetical protein